MTKQFSTVISVVALLSIFMVVMFISMTATTEAEGFRLDPSEKLSEKKYYESCPFRKAELEDLTAEKSIRAYVEFKDVYCDEEQKTERVVVRFIGHNPEVSSQLFQKWLNAHQLQPSNTLQIIVSE